MEEPKEELEPLFDYTRVQPAIAFRFDDTDLETSDIFVHCKRRKAAAAAAAGKEDDERSVKGVAVEVVVDGEAAEACGKDGGGEEDWLPPPPPPAKAGPEAEAEKDMTLQELRLKKQELACFAQSAQDILQKLVESATEKLEAKQPPEHIVLDEPPQPQMERTRQRIVITIQDKNGHQQFRIYKDDRFDKILKAYATKAKLNPSDLVFSFDGDKVNPSSTPEGLGLEDDDIIEVHHKLH